MKWYDMLRIAWKGRGRLGLAAGTFLLAGAFFFSIALEQTLDVKQQKSQPWELSVSVERFTENDLAAILSIDGVVDATPVYEVPASLLLGGYTEDLTICGVKGSYLQKTVAEGILFPEGGTMPYLLLNREALKVLKDSQGKKAAEDALPDWKQSAARIQSGESAAIPVQICGIFREGESPEAYMDMEMAKKILRSRGEIPRLEKLLVRITDAGAQERVDAALSQLGAVSENTDTESLAIWQVKDTQNQYRGLLTVTCWLAAAALLCLRMGIDRAAGKQEGKNLEMLGIPGAVYGRIGLLRLWIYMAVWSAAGIGIYLLLRCAGAVGV